MATHGIVVDIVSGGVRPIDSLEGAAIGIPAQCSELTAGDLALVRTDADLLAIDDGTNDAGITPIVAMIRAQGNTAPIVVLAVASGAVTSSAATYTGAFRLLQAEAELGVKPTILAQALSGVTHSDMFSVANRLKAIAYIDGPNTNDAAALTAAAALSSSRGHFCDPAVVDQSDNVIGSSVLYAAIASNVSFWETPSNKPVDGVLGVKSLSRTVGFEMGDANSQANLLNEGKVNTLIRKSGWRLWGGLSLGTDPNYKFINVARTEDIIGQSIQAAFLYAVDKGLTKSVIEDITDTVQAFLDNLTARGAILGGKAWVNKDLNTTTSLQAGHLYVDYSFNPVPPLYSLHFRSTITNTYLASLVA